MLLDLAFVFVLAMVAAGVGLRVLRVLGRPIPSHPSDAWALALPIGLGLLAMAMLGLGEVSGLSPGAIGLTLGIAAAIGLPASIREVRRLVGAVRAARRSPAWDTLLAIVLLGTLVTALAPVTDGDALCYHLQVPKVFLARAAVFFDADLHETVYPLLTEMLYAIALAWRGPVACRLIQWLLGVVFALNVSALARPVLGDRARWAGVVALLVPAVSNGMGAPLNDVALAAFGNAALHAFSRWHDRPGMRASVLVGGLAGLAMGVKYPALVLAGLIGLAMLADWARDALKARAAYVPAVVDEWRVRGRRGVSGGVSGASWVVRQINGREYIDPRAELAYTPTPLTAPRRHVHRFRYALAFGLVALAVGGPWYARAYGSTGNPVYPFFRGVFGGAGLDEVLDPIKRPMPATAWNLLTAIGPLTLDPARFDSVSHQFGPLFLLVLPALLWERPPRRVWMIVGLGYAFLTICLTQRQSMRFLLIAVGPLSVGVAWVAARWFDRPGLPARALAALLIACLGFEATIALARARHGIGVVLGRETADAYLRRREPTYRVGRWIDANLPESARLVGQDHRGYYFPRAYAMELAHRRRTGLGTRGESPEAIVEALRVDGFTHLLLCPPEPPDSVEFDPALGRLLAPWLDRREPLYRERITDPDGVSRRYAIYPLDPARPVAGLAAPAPGGRL